MIQKILILVLMITFNSCYGPLMSEREVCVADNQRNGFSMDAGGCLLFGVLANEIQLYGMSKLFWYQCYMTAVKAKECNKESNIIPWWAQ